MLALARGRSSGPSGHARFATHVTARRGGKRVSSPSRSRCLNKTGFDLLRADLRFLLMQ
jgi:hypothetical protein